MGMTFNRQLPEPQIIKELYPVSEEIKNIKSARDEEIKKVFTGRDLNSGLFRFVRDPNRHNNTTQTCRHGNCNRTHQFKNIVHQLSS